MCITGSIIQLGSLIYNPPRNGPTVWEIGIPDRSAAEFHVPNPYPNLINRLYIGKPLHKLVQNSINNCLSFSPAYIHHFSVSLNIDFPTNSFRQYGIWKRYNELYPNEDLTYTVGVSDYSKDWFYAQVPR